MQLSIFVNVIINNVEIISNEKNIINARRFGDHNGLHKLR